MPLAATHPALVLADDNGGSGKNTFVQVLKTVFRDLDRRGVSRQSIHVLKTLVEEAIDSLDR